MADAIHIGTTSETINMRTGSANVMIGTAVADKLYSLTCPMLELSGYAVASLQHADRVSVTPAGQIII